MRGESVTCGIDLQHSAGIEAGNATLHQESGGLIFVHRNPDVAYLQPSREDCYNFNFKMNMVWSLHNIKEASFDLFRHPSLGNQLTCNQCACIVTGYSRNALNSQFFCTR